MKRFISIFISSAMLFTSSVCAGEVSTDFWAYEQVMEANNDGWLDKSLDPNDYALKSTAEMAAGKIRGVEYDAIEDIEEYITRGELAEMIGEFLPDNNFGISFSDTADSEYADSINKCAGAGIFNGYSDGTFKPEKNVTNAELAAVISKLKKNRTEAYELYEKINEKYKDLKSFTIDMNIDMDVDMKFKDINEEHTNTVSTGTFKAVINDLEKFDIEISGSMDTSFSDGGKMTTDIYYNDGTYYVKAGDYSKVKMKLDFNEVMSQMGLDYNSISQLNEDAFGLGYVKVNDDKTKDLYVSINTDKIFSKFDFIPSDVADQIKNMTQVVHIDENDNMTGYDLYYSMKLKDDGTYFNYDISAEYKLRDMNNTVVDVPDGLDEYKDPITIDDIIQSADYEEDETESESSDVISETSTEAEE